MILSELPEQAWRGDAACIDEDPAIFFPERGASNELAKAICARCPVRAACLDWALHHEKFGTWGGASERARRRMRRRLKIRLVDDADPFDPLPDIDELDDGTRTRQEIADALGVTRNAVDKRCIRRKASA